MKAFTKIALVLSIAIGSQACAFGYDIEGERVSCIGFQEDPNPAYVYETSVRNVVWTVLGGPSVLVPIIWATTAVRCPVRKAPVNTTTKSRALTPRS